MDYIRKIFPSLLTKKGTNYKNEQFWNNLYLNTTEKEYEWGFKPKDIEIYTFKNVNNYGMSITTTINDTIPNNQPTLLIGAGSSRLGEMLYTKDFKPLIQTDFSEIVVNQKKKECEHLYPEMIWERADARESLTPLLKLIQKPNEDPIYFGSVIDKGLIDALYLGNDNIDVEIPKIVSNVVEVLDPDWGVFVTFSRSHPDCLEKYLKNTELVSIEARRLEYPDIYLYRLCRGAQSVAYY